MGAGNQHGALTWLKRDDRRVLGNDDDLLAVYASRASESAAECLMIIASKLKNIRPATAMR